MTRINLPPSGKADGKLTGCYGLEFPTGEKITGAPGRSVDVDDRQAAMIRGSSAARLGIISGSMSLSFGTKKGRWCDPCTRMWNAWSATCPNCDAPTVPVEEGEQ